MDLIKLRESSHLSASAVTDYLDCGLLYKFGRLDKLPMEFRSDALEFGSTAHKVLEEHYRMKMEGKRLSTKELHQIFEKYWREAAEGKEDIRYSEGKDFETLLLEGKELLTVYHNKIPEDNFKIVGIEEPFSFTIEGCPVPLIGAADLIEEDESGTLIITDWKTSGRAYSNDEVDRNFQLTVYQMAAKANGYSEREILLKLDCLIKSKKTPRFEQYYSSRTEDDENRAVRKILEVWNGISRGVFIPNDSSSNWRCKNCPYQKACADWFRRKPDE